MKCPTSLFVPTGLIATKTDFAKQVRNNNKSNNNVSFDANILDELQRARELFNQSKDSNDENEVIKRAKEYLSILHGFVYEPTKIEEEEVVSETQQDGTILMTREQHTQSKKSTDTTFSKLRYTLSFEWSSSLNKKSKSKVNDVLYEVVMVLLVVINSLSQQAQYAIMNDNGKKCFKLLLSAYGMCEYASNISKELDKSAMEALSFEFNAFQRTKVTLNIIKSQVQEMGFYAALEKENKFELVAKISRGSFESYSQCKSSIVGVDATVAPYSSFVDFKCCVWDCLGRIHSAVYSNHKEQNGVAIALVKSVKELIPDLKKKADKLSNHPCCEKSLVLEQKDNIVSSCNRFEEKFNKENTIVYHQEIPEHVEDLPVNPTIMGTPTPFEYPHSNALWTQQVYSSFNLLEYRSENSVIAIKEETTVNTVPSNENADAMVVDEDPVEKSVKKRERSPEQDDEIGAHIKKSARYDSGGVSLCVIC